MEWIFRKYYGAYKKSNFARSFKRRRYQRIIDALSVEPPTSILEIGCSTGSDFMAFACDARFRCHGVDIRDWPQTHDFVFTRADACDLPFPDKHFDAAVSIGLFEHIQPIERLCLAASEIARVAKHYCVVVPSIGTLIEPHALSPLWCMRDRTKKRTCSDPLIAMSDEGWLQFSGFRNAQTQRFWYMPGIQNLMITGHTL